MHIITSGALLVNGHQVEYEVLRDHDMSTIVSIESFGRYLFDPNTESTVLELFGSDESLFSDGDRELMWSIFYAKERFTLEGLYKQAAEAIIWSRAENQVELSA